MAARLPNGSKRFATLSSGLTFLSFPGADGALHSQNGSGISSNVCAMSVDLRIQMHGPAHQLPTSTMMPGFRGSLQFVQCLYLWFRDWPNQSTQPLAVVYVLVFAPQFAPPLWKLSPVLITKSGQTTTLQIRASLAR